MKLKELQKQKSLEGMKKKVQANQSETQQSDKESGMMCKLFITIL